MAGPPITLTSDFGLSDPYAASVKGVILSINPDATILDVTHEVLPQQIEQGAFVLQAAAPYFPPGAIHVAVVDPGVGGERRAIALATERAVFVGTDNGVLSAALPDQARPDPEGLPTVVALPAGIEARLLSEPRFHRLPVSSTFHGRDIFGPVAAHLSLGVPLAELGPRVQGVVALPAFRGAVQPDGSVVGRVLHIDRFGNLVTSVRAEQIPDGAVAVEICGRRIEGLTRTYAEGSGAIALVGSSGVLEIAVSGGSARDEIGASIGDRVAVRPA